MLTREDINSLPVPDAKFQKAKSYYLGQLILTPSQHGFLKSRSCLTNMLCFLEEITKWIDEGSPVTIMYLAFQKAIDKVLHERLLFKLKAHGI